MSCCWRFIFWKDHFSFCFPTDNSNALLVRIGELLVTTPNIPVASESRSLSASIILHCGRNAPGFQGSRFLCLVTVSALTPQIFCGRRGARVVDPAGFYGWTWQMGIHHFSPFPLTGAQPYDPRPVVRKMEKCSCPVCK